MSTQQTHERLLIRWTTLKGFIALLLFVIIAVLLEYVVVLYATSMGLKDEILLQSTLTLPGTAWALTIAVSPLFHLVPVAVVITLGACWTYLARHIALRPNVLQRSRYGQVAGRGKQHRMDRFFSSLKSRLLEVRGIAYLRRATIKSAVAVLFVFLIFAVGFSVLTNPQIIYFSVANAYKSNPILVGFVKGVSNVLSPVGSVFSSINYALLANSPGFRDFGLSLGKLIQPLTDLELAEKYLLFQNVAAWISALFTLFYIKYAGRTFRYQKK